MGRYIRRLNKMRIKFLLFLFLFPILASAAIEAPVSVLQGDVVVLKTDKEVTSATFGGESMAVFPYQTGWRAIAGVGPTKVAGNYNARLYFADGTKEARLVTVKVRKFAKIILPVPEKLQMTPKTLVTNLQAQNKAINATVAEVSKQVYFSRLFGLPLYDNRRLGSLFGEIRQTGAESIRHLGVDFPAATGTPVAAINDGIVKQSSLDTLYGNSVIIEHGAGIYTLYLHLNERRVKAGEKVVRGKIIGTVGQTGYASGPHLHLSVKVGGISVDPIRFVGMFR